MINYKRRLSMITLAATVCISSNALAGTDLYIGEVMITAATYCPRGTTELNGQLLPIAQNSSLFSLIGTTYGGDGRTTFKLPDLRSRSPMHAGVGNGLQNRIMGQQAGSPTATLSVPNLPIHDHNVVAHKHAIPGHGHTAALKAAPNQGNINSPQDNSLAQYVASPKIYRRGNPDADGTALTMSSGSVVVADASTSDTAEHPRENTLTAGGNTPFQIQSPVLVLRFCIALVGVYPPRN